jgi:hypothetical protein
MQASVSPKRPKTSNIHNVTHGMAVTTVNAVMSAPSFCDVSLIQGIFFISGMITAEAAV